MSTTEQIIIEIIATSCDIEPGRVRLDATLKELDIHSLDAVQLLFEIEDRFDVHVPERDDRYAAGTVSELVAGVERLLLRKSSVT